MGTSRTGLEQLRSRVMAYRVLIKAFRLQVCSTKFDPQQPRIPRGRPDGGQWTAVGRSSSPRRLAMGKWNQGNYEKCEAQYEKDIFQCRMMLWNPFCVDQTISRRTACMKDDPIPDFFHVM